MPAKAIEQKWKEIVSGSRNDRFARFARGTLSAASKLFGIAVRSRTKLYEHGIFKRSWPGCVVISIGNITVGGTGKTPVTETFARALTAGGRKVAIVSRGYKAKSPSLKWRRKHKQLYPTTLVVHDGKNLLLGARVSGDEPYMLARNLENVIVIVDHDRVRGSRYAISHFGVDTILLDDGMQHIRLQRQIDVVLIDATCPFGFDKLLPAGLLREPLSGLRRATHIIITKSKNVDINPIKAVIRKYNDKAEIMSCYYEPVSLVNLHTGECVPIETIKDNNVFVMTGIAQPEGFITLLKENGATVQRVYTYPDHHRFRRDEIEHVYRRAANWHTDAVIITEKDSVRFSKKAGLRVRNCPIYYLKIEIKIQSGEKKFSDCIMNICYP
ncbi:MAG: tetraacyldisaccharide 4'-kinase [Chlamydiae bacterium]|nr:MAG: tetraacyldisaccharide 4'-kinase [Chlamydiota bacterium]